ncbi:D-xylose-proton symporter-like 2 [Hirschfeldia incana]|nr:D-xylose-proton symporter-like 2 [Hirschfeldia incana]
MGFDPEKQTIVSPGQTGDSSSGGTSSVKEPLIKEENHHSPENYSVLAAIPPFLFPALGALLFGYEIGATSCATISIKSPTLSGISWYNLSSVDVGIITSGSLYGALIGSIVAFTVADIIGRRKELILAAFLYLVGAIVTAVAPVFSVLIIGRLMYGIGVGLTMHAAPMYIAETAPSQIRGRMISLKEFFTVLGMVGGYGIGSLWVTVTSGWRYMYATIIPLPVIMGIGMCWLPASPRWLLLRSLQGKGNVENLQQAAIKSLRRLRGSVVVDSSVEQVNEILAELSSVGEEDKEATLGELFQGKCLKALTIAGGLVLLQQITGQPSVLYYAPSILQTAGFSAATDATRISILLGLLKLVMTGVAVIVIDRLGRRPLLLGGVSGMMISLFLLGSYYIFYNTVPAVAVVALLLYVGCYQLSFGPIGWLMISEIFPLKLRGRGISIAVLVNFGTNALVTFAFSPLKELLGAGVLFCGFGVICVVSLVFIYFIVPETKGLTLEEIEAKCL